MSTFRIARILFFVFITTLMLSGSIAMGGYEPPKSNGNSYPMQPMAVNAPNDDDWVLVATDPNEDPHPEVEGDLKAVYTQMQNGVVFFKIETYQKMGYYVAIYLDTDQDPRTGLPDRSSELQNSNIGTDYKLIIAEPDRTGISKWNPTLFDFGDSLPFAYIDYAYNSTVAVVGVNAQDLQTDGFLDFAVNTHEDWLPDSGYLPFIKEKSVHQLAVTLETPSYVKLGSSVRINTTVYNFGASDETNLHVGLLINGESVGTYENVNLTTGKNSGRQLSWLWQPNQERIFNVTTYVTAVSGEAVLEDNAKTRMVPVGAISDTFKIALISDRRSFDMTYIIDSMGLNYDIYFNGASLYTENLTLLSEYQAVIFNKENRAITSAEESVLNAYLNAGGNLLVTGNNSLGKPDDQRLANVVHSSSSGHHTGTPYDDYLIVDAFHPITNGPYGKFSIGQEIPDYYDENDEASADTSKGAITLAELEDGCDKIIATESIPGKVVYWNGDGIADWGEFNESKAMLMNTLIWFMDKSAPITFDDYDGLWHSANYAINLVAGDFFGLPETYYKINGGATKNLRVDGQPQITVESDSNTLEYWSVDWVGHEENHKTVTNIKLDKTAPTASITTSLVQPGSYTVKFDASGSTDSSGITSYKWSFGDNSQGTGITVNHAYATFGTYTATLTVTDTVGNSAEKSVAVTLYNASPEATPKPTPKPPTPTPSPTATPSPSPTPTSTTQPTATPQPIEITTIALILISIVIAALLIGGATFYLKKRKTKKIRLKFKKEEKV